MCGIFGVVSSLGSQPPNFDRFRAALSLLDHRGPDGRKAVRVSEGVVLGHTRLSIIDLDHRSDQPMLLGGRYWIVYNGELFNYVELRVQLIGLGCIFTTAGDTEVILHAYATWGARCVTRFNGMWAFAIYDVHTTTLFCSRDRFGEKPFNYALLSGQFLFASECKAILAYNHALSTPSYNSIANYCRTSVGAQHAQTWFEQVHRLQPGHNLEFRDGRIRTERYWSYPCHSEQALGFEDQVERYRELFRDAVRIRMRSDVPIGLTLSSGLDSSSIACQMKAISGGSHHAFCSQFEDASAFLRKTDVYRSTNAVGDESLAAERLAKSVGHEFLGVTTSYSGIVNSLSSIVYHLESGNSSPAVIPLMQLYSAASNKVRVLLEGQGADELLGGYIPSLLIPATSELISHGCVREAWQTLSNYRLTYTLRNAILMFLRTISNKHHFLAHWRLKWSGIESAFGGHLRRYTRILDYPEDLSGHTHDRVQSLLQQQHSGGLVNLLHYGDALSMAHGVETRLPFLDHRLVEFVWPLPTRSKIRLGTGKFIHREAMRGIVPSSILNQRVKLGFPSPISSQFTMAPGMASDAVETLLSRRCCERGIFARNAIVHLINDHQKCKADHGNLLFRLLSTEIWFRTFIDQPVSRVV